jgi:demethylmenaquinone methyltransferase/2-methoxy-6-polyprenyl-1,4-benzoquinol methylase
MDKKSAINFFDDLAHEWDSLQNPIFTARIPALIARTSIKKGDRIADVACGTGILYPFLQSAGAGEILCLDISAKMLGQLKKKHPAAKTLAAAFEEADLPLNYFDKVLLFNALPHFAAPQNAANKAYEMLKKGGVFCILHSLSRKELAAAHVGREEVVEDKLPPPSGLKKIFLSAGFNDIVLKEDNNGCFFSGRKK